MEAETEKVQPLLTKKEVVVIALVAAGAGALAGLLVMNQLDIRLLRRHTDHNSATINAILLTLQDEGIIQNLKFGA